jgi:hypothetical protein
MNIKWFSPLPREDVRIVGLVLAVVLGGCWFAAVLGGSSPTARYFSPTHSAPSTPTATKEWSAATKECARQLSRSLGPEYTRAELEVACSVWGGTR